MRAAAARRRRQSPQLRAKAAQRQPAPAAPPHPTPHPLTAPTPQFSNFFFTLMCSVMPCLAAPRPSPSRHPMAASRRYPALSFCTPWYRIAGPGAPSTAAAAMPCQRGSGGEGLARAHMPMPLCAPCNPLPASHTCMSTRRERSQRAMQPPHLHAVALRGDWRGGAAAWRPARVQLGARVAAARAGELTGRAQRAGRRPNACTAAPRNLPLPHATCLPCPSPTHAAQFRPCAHCTSTGNHAQASRQTVKAPRSSSTALLPAAPPARWRGCAWL